MLCDGRQAKEVPLLPFLMSTVECTWYRGPPCLHLFDNRTLIPEVQAQERTIIMHDVENSCPDPHREKVRSFIARSKKPQVKVNIRAKDRLKQCPLP